MIRKLVGLYRNCFSGHPSRLIIRWLIRRLRLPPNKRAVGIALEKSLHRIGANRFETEISAMSTTCFDQLPLLNASKINMFMSTQVIKIFFGPQKGK